jgi:hypothetical protein
MTNEQRNENIIIHIPGKKNQIYHSQAEVQFIFENNFK